MVAQRGESVFCGDEPSIRDDRVANLKKSALNTCICEQHYVSAGFIHKFIYIHMYQ